MTIRELWVWFNATARRYAPEGTLRWHAVTWVGHTLLTVVLWLPFGLPDLLGLEAAWSARLRTLGAGCGPGLYIVEQFRQSFIDDPPSTAPWWDGVLDVLIPLVVSLWFLA